MIRLVLTLARVSNLPTVWSNCLAAWLISGQPLSWTLLTLLLGTSLFYAGGCTLNDAFDAGWDAKFRPDRLIPSGAISRRKVGILGGTEMALGFLVLTAAGLSTFWPPVLLVAAILFYDVWHKQSPLSVLIMGGCRWLLYLTAGAVAGQTTGPVAVAGGIMFFYIVILSLIARGEAKAAATRPPSRWLLPLLPLAVGLTAPPNFLLATSGVVVTGALLIKWVLPHPVTPGGAVNTMLAAIPLLDLWLVVARIPTRHFLWLPCFVLLYFVANSWQKRFKAT